MAHGDIYAELITGIKLDFLPLEKCKKLWRAASVGSTSENLKKMRCVGYITPQRLANMLEYGVPQDKGRIFLFGIWRDVLEGSEYRNLPVRA